MSESETEVLKRAPSLSKLFKKDFFLPKEELFIIN